MRSELMQDLLVIAEGGPKGRTQIHVFRCVQALEPSQQSRRFELTMPRMKMAKVNHFEKSRVCVCPAPKVLSCLLALRAKEFSLLISVGPRTIETP